MRVIYNYTSKNNKKIFVNYYFNAHHFVGNLLLKSNLNTFTFIYNKLYLTK